MNTEELTKDLLIKELSDFGCAWKEAHGQIPESSLVLASRQAVDRIERNNPELGKECKHYELKMFAESVEKKSGC